MKTINTGLRIIGGLGMAALLIGFWSVASSLIMYCLFVNRYTEVVFWGGLFVVWVVYENRHLFKRKRAAT